MREGCRGAEVQETEVNQRNKLCTCAPAPLHPCTLHLCTPAPLHPMHPCTGCEGYTGFVVRSFRTFATLALLLVLTGGPIATVVCAEWCAPSRNAAGASVHHQVRSSGHAPATAIPSAAAECHRNAGSGPSVAAHSSPECLDYALSSNAAGPIAPRLQVAPPMSQTADVIADAPHAMLRAAGLASHVVHSPPSRPLAASPVLRI
jgi:hypothetical protein